MSSSAFRRQKDLNAGGTQKPIKALTPISNPTLKKSSSGKENSRVNSSSRSAATAQKPVTRPVPRLEKAAAGLEGGERDGRVRWSTSSAPRGRSPSPSQFIRVYSDSKKDRVSMGKEKKGFSDLKAKGSENGLRASKDSKGSGRFGENLVLKAKESEKKAGGIKVLDGNCHKAANMSSNLVKSSGINDADCGLEASSEKATSSCGSKVRAGVSVDENEKFEGKHSSVSNSDDRVGKITKEKTLKDIEVCEVSEEKNVVEGEGVGCGVGIKYPSKLHEKLAFLETKVKRIASDIKRTKEMLDMNNPDESKVILSDIQDKISGIEKAMNHVVTDTDGKTSVLQSSKTDNVDAKIGETSQVGKAKISVKELNSEELEARLLPHHKLLRNRTSLKSSAECYPSHEPSNSVERCSGKKEDDKSLSSIEDNPIALEFLASLERKQTKVTMRSGHGDLETCDVQEMDGDGTSFGQDSLNMLNLKSGVEMDLTTDERVEDFDDQENSQPVMYGEEAEDANADQLNEIGGKNSTGGWFVSEGEAVLLAHDDGSCSFYDIANTEEKAVYTPPAGAPSNMWRDCWIIRATSADGCSGRYVVAASAGNSLESGFCSWDFYTKDVQAFHIENGVTSSRSVLGSLPNNMMHRRNLSCNTSGPETQQWWYKPCGPLIISTATSQKVVKVYDIRDGEQIMQWEVQKPVLTLDYSSPLQWRNRGKVVVAERETISLWDVNSLHPQALLSVSSSGRKISALHVNNTDAEIGGGVRQRVSSSEAEGNDGVFCTPDSINILDFRHPSGIGAKIPKVGVNVQSVSSRGDSIFLGCSNVRSAGKKLPCSQVQQFSLRKQRLFSTYSMPESSAHPYYSAITQVWGNSNIVMGVCGLGLFVFDALRDDGLQSFTGDHGAAESVGETIGPDDLYCPSFDYLGSRALLISRDRPALWRHLL